MGQVLNLPWGKKQIVLNLPESWHFGILTVAQADLVVSIGCIELEYN